MTVMYVEATSEDPKLGSSQAFLGEDAPYAISNSCSTSETIDQVGEWIAASTT